MTGFHTGHTWFRDNMPQVRGVAESFGKGQRRLFLRAEDLTVADLEAACPEKAGSARLLYGTHPALDRCERTDWIKVLAAND